jgi:hypothetical protein
MELHLGEIHRINALRLFAAVSLRGVALLFAFSFHPPSGVPEYAAAGSGMREFKALMVRGQEGREPGSGSV